MTWQNREQLAFPSALPGVPSVPVDLSSFSELLRRQAPELLPVNKHAGFDLDDKFKLTGTCCVYLFLLARHRLVLNRRGSTPVLTQLRQTEPAFTDATRKLMNTESPV